MSELRPFALLRASGMRLSELRRIVLLETGVPLVATVLGGVGLAMALVYTSMPRAQWVAPSAHLLGSLGIGLLAALAVSAIALPFMNIATRYDNARFE